MESVIETTTVALTPAAADVVRDLISQRNLDESYALRVYVSGRSCSGFQYGMGLENKPGDTDTTFESEGLKVIVDEVSLQYMTGATIDFIDDERGKGFMVENPNEAPSCDCGSGGCGCSDN
ncbi:MAG TPA: iron-sulfur cluster assembly accessory protein [Anaerolineales bacterium]|nr:iron-sulfur cluster assembly accessory protein [Anaerolineales bacterium]